ncbi:MAG: Two component transcriptional regulator, AraC family [Herbinix sp.]|jgi:two-component system response regulator YesN|nr:Two component transcriptional regulator, AraC family [Herbinix sp.]
MYRLVVIDDEYIVVRGIEAIIKRERLNCEVVGAAYNGIEALALLKEIKPDIVITDIRIPKMDGLSLIEEAKEFLPEAYFIVISGFKEFEYARRALSMGVKRYIDKPITIDKVREVFKWIEQEELKKKAASKPGDLDFRRQELEELTDKMLDNIIENDTDLLKEHFRKFMLAVQAYFPEINQFRRECLRLLCVLSEFYSEKEKGSNWSSNISFEEMNSKLTYQDIHTYSEKILEKIIGNMETQNKSVNHRDIKQLLAYIGSHYSQDIGLNELAEQVGLNPVYLSVLFKEEVGMSYIKYLTNLRIKKAKEYLLGDYKVAQVSEMVGYNNYRHFCDIFKKYVGQSPNEYKGCVRSKDRG